MDRLKNFFKDIVFYIKDNLVFLLFMILLYIILTFPLNYYIVIGGGTSDVSSRIEVLDGYSSKGSFNISYVSELKGNVISYLLSFIIPTWEVEDANNFKYNVKESIEDIEFRSDLDLKCANSNATYWAYKLAKKDIQLIDSKIYVITIFPDFDSNLKVGDEILSIEGKHYDTVEEYREIIRSSKEGDKLEVVVKRKNKEITLSVPLFLYKENVIMGAGLQVLDSYKVDPIVNIKFKRAESGPSGGLITTLEIYNQLIKKDITKGLKIAGTGTIEKDGSIGEIGGVEHKLLGASSDKADVFLVPEGDNYKEAIKYKKDKKLKIKIIAVKSIEDAISKLDNLKLK